MHFKILDIHFLEEKSGNYRPVARGGQGGHDPPPMKLTVACAVGHFAPVRSATNSDEA